MRILRFLSTSVSVFSAALAGNYEFGPALLVDASEGDVDLVFYRAP